MYAHRWLNISRVHIDPRGNDSCSIWSLIRISSYRYKVINVTINGMFWHNFYVYTRAQAHTYTRKRAPPHVRYTLDHMNEICLEFAMAQKQNWLCSLLQTLCLSLSTELDADGKRQNWAKKRKSNWHMKYPQTASCRVEGIYKHRHTQTRSYNG